MKRTSRKPSTLSESVQRHLNAYALAASAAGVGMLALTQSAEARIVYTKTHHVIGTNGIYNLDLNHDGIIDFVIYETGSPSSYASNALRVKEAWGNAVEGSNGKYNTRWAAALKQGAQIGPSQHFVASTKFGAIMIDIGCTSRAAFRNQLTCLTYGQWRNVTNHYLGLKFKVHKKTHYGWARLTVQLPSKHIIKATLTGYAYETIPYKAIITGKTKGPDVEPAALGHLARGASAVSAWRVKRTAATTH
jgi:hypothetical protein